MAGTGSAGPSRRRRSARPRSSRARGASISRIGGNRWRRSAGADWRWTRSAAPHRTWGCCRCSTWRRRGPTSSAARWIRLAPSCSTPMRIRSVIRSPTRSGIRGVAAFVAANDGELVEAAAIARAVEESADLLGLARHDLGRLYAGLAMVEVHLSATSTRTHGSWSKPFVPTPSCINRLTVQVDVALQQAKLARSLGDVAGAEAFLTQARASPTPSPMPGCVRCSVRRRSLRRCGSTRRGRAPLIVELDPDRAGDAGADGTPGVAPARRPGGGAAAGRSSTAVQSAGQGRAGGAECAQRARARRR